MIFVTVGSQLSFDRLIRAVEEWARARGRDDVVFQVGDGGHTPSGFECVESLGPDAFEERVRGAELVVGHAGTGTIMAALMAGRPVVCLARREALGETRNDHQVATLERFAAREGVFGTADESELGAQIDAALAAEAPAEALGPFAEGPIVDRLRSFLEEYVERPEGKKR